MTFLRLGSHVDGGVCFLMVLLSRWSRAVGLVLLVPASPVFHSMAFDRHATSRSTWSFKSSVHAFYLLLVAVETLTSSLAVLMVVVPAGAGKCDRAELERPLVDYPGCQAVSPLTQTVARTRGVNMVVFGVFF